jgi:polyisoprenoid-binding protein YceI
MSAAVRPNATEVQRTTTVWQIDPVHTTVEFAVRHMMIATVRGHFSKVSGTVGFDPEADPSTWWTDITIDAASIDTREEQRDNHLRSPDFLDVANHPTITFKSKRVEVLSPDKRRFRVVGDLTIRGITREEVLEAEYLGRVKDPYGNERVGFSATTTINRKDYGANWNMVLEAGGFIVGDELKVTIEVEASRQP